MFKVSEIHKRHFVTNMLSGVHFLVEEKMNMSEKEKQLTMNCVKIITDKMYKGCVDAGLSCDDEKYTTYINETSKWFPIPSVQNKRTGGEYVRAYNIRMIDFMDMVYNPEKWASKR